METVRAAVEERTLEPQRTTTTTSTQQQQQQHRSLIIFYLCVKAVETAQREPQEEEVEKEENLKGQPTTIVASAQEVKLEEVEESVGNNKCTRNVFTARISLPDINHSSLLVHSRGGGCVLLRVCELSSQITLLLVQCT